MIGRVRDSVAQMPSYRPGKSAAQAEEEHGISDAIKLASNENPWPPVPEIAAAMEAAVAGVNRYGDNRASDLRDALGAWLDVSPSAIAVGCGSSGVLQQLFFTYVDPGDEVVFPWPSFEVYPVFSKLFGATDVRTDLVDFGFDMEATAAAVTDRTKLVFLATPNNPTGTAFSTAEVAPVLDAIGHDVIVVIDEAYREFTDPSLGDPITDLLPRYPNVVVTRTFSKSYGIAGIRVGYALADPEVVEQLDKVLLPFSVNTVAQAGALAAIEHDAAARERVEQLMIERDRMVASLADAGWSIPKPYGNFVFIPTDDRTIELATAMERNGVVVRPFEGFGLRITISTPAENDRWLRTFLDTAGRDPR